MNKHIQKSKRGLTFSFPSAGKLAIGNAYDYIIDKQNGGSIHIVSAENGKHHVSRKRSGMKWLSLIDLRCKDVLAAITEMDSICVSISESEIIIRDATLKTTALAKRKVYVIQRSDLSGLRMAAGISDTYAVDALLDNAQITCDEYLAAIGKQAVSVPTIQKDLADIYTLVSLFSGAGILDWPFAQDDRFQIQYAIDYEAAACETYRRNIGLHIVNGDVHRAFTNDGYPLDNTVAEPDVIIGGPSCKPFSSANSHTRLEDHPDSDLLMQYMRIVRTLNPKVFAIENVPQVLTACDGSYFDAIKQVAEECGYDLGARIVQDNKVGGFTTRKRAIILGSRIGPVRFGEVSLASGSRTAGDALCKVNRSWSNYDDVTLPGSEAKKRMSFVPQGGNFESIPEEFRTESKNRHSCAYRRLAWSEPSPTIVNWRKPPLIHPTEDRTLTVAEAKALQGLPGNSRICGTLGQMQQQVGNSVPVAIGQFIKASVLAMLKQSCKGLVNGGLNAKPCSACLL